MEFIIEKFAKIIMKCSKRHLTDIMELPNQNKIRMLREKETYKYLDILEADSIKQVKMIKTLRKTISEELQSYLRQNYVAETLSKEKIPGLPTSFGILCEMDKR